ncbi:MAG: YhjD/YihY/BrkB family envelope integrity protein [Methylotenera sp.]|jgi:membrane protein|uniref:YhjD/YihY/BrkB family envelope integrity protein n=1 Tax=Methylotenera sp. TaxID=2051956 RepID=UPI002720B0DB|nr:YhjD/YihY/BrkB family envelope integrity protein [Methylotenera sp.]MDO9149988.1 YhjD/YihY/BrkB family envelope integrity protein [Methylotenera sp.]
MKKITFSPKSNLALRDNMRKAINMPKEVYANQRYNTPLFVFHEMFKAFQRHNALSLSASLSFYAMFALIPLVLLMFFLFSQLIFSSDYAIVKLAIITSNLIPELSNSIMTEVYSTARHQAAWGALGLFVLIWTVTPLAGAMRAAFYSIASLVEAPSFIKRKVKDIFAIIGMLLLFFVFTFAGLMLEKVIIFLGASSQYLEYEILATLMSLCLTTLLISIFYFVFFPARLYIKHILIGALFTALLWLLMRPAFTLFLSMNESYGSVFGSMKNLFISITWLYVNFAVFLLGTELIATLRKKDVLLLKGLFSESPERSVTTESHYVKKLMQRYGKIYEKNDIIFKHGEATSHLYYLVSGEVKIIKQNKVLRTVHAGEYFGEMAMLSNTPTIAEARVGSINAEVITMDTDNIETLLLDEPKVAMKFLRKMAARLQQQDE